MASGCSPSVRASTPTLRIRAPDPRPDPILPDPFCCTRQTRSSTVTSRVGIGTSTAPAASRTDSGGPPGRAAGGRADVLVCDCTDVDAVTEVIGGAPSHWDVLVNNAGTNRPQRFLEVTREAFETVMQINVTGAFFVAQAVAAKMAAAGEGGSIIHMSSQMGHVGGARRSVYCTSKHAVEGMTKAMAIDLAPHRIRVNSVCPTFVVTPMTAPYFEDEAFLADTLGRIPIGRLAQVNDVTGAVVFLASDAAAMITGSALKVDGGWTAV